MSISNESPDPAPRLTPPAGFIFAQPCEFIAGAATVDSLPPASYPEIAFIGRSNVGKSSLINALVGRKALARTSQNPGLTKQLNFFRLGENRERVQIDRALGSRGEARGAYTSYVSTPSQKDNDAHGKNEPALILVDMPGYGYAKVSKERKGQWDTLIRSYLGGRATLKRACLLIDARRGVMPPDEEFMSLLDETAVSFQIVLTKTDTLTGKDLSVLLQAVDQTIKAHVAAHPQVIATSSLNKDGIEALREELSAFSLWEKGGVSRDEGPHPNPLPKGEGK